ncbi:MAG: Rrf2 family transcriptional regulator [Gemmataceae bacterium]|nr:Rrf2 family transcriptional regulator [Gemmataceae bacterium]
MALLNRKVDYSILVLSHLNEHRTGASARGIAERYGLSQAFVANILKLLCRKGFVSSHRGVHGGYVMEPHVPTVNLAELIAALDETFQLAECSQAVGDHQCAVGAGCPVKEPLTHVHLRLQAVLQDVTLAELFHPVAQPLTLGLPMVEAGMIPVAS